MQILRYDELTGRYEPLPLSEFGGEEPPLQRGKQLDETDDWPLPRPRADIGAIVIRWFVLASCVGFWAWVLVKFVR